MEQSLTIEKTENKIIQSKNFLGGHKHEINESKPGLQL